MAVTGLSSFEIGNWAVDAVCIGFPNSGTSLFGSAAYSGATVRTGTQAMRCNPASGAQGYASISATLSAVWVHFAINFAAFPTVDRLIFSDGSTNSLKITSAGALAYYDGVTLVGTSSVLETGTWYWIGFRSHGGTAVDLLQIDGVTQVTGTTTNTTSFPAFGFSGTEASAADAFFDDVVLDNAGFLAPSKVALLSPTADSAVGTGWTLGTGTAISAGSGSTAVKNKPPLGVADLAAGSDTKQIRNATSNANSNYDATMTTYAAAGVGANDTVLAVLPIVITGAPVTTSAKQGTVGITSNPAVANIALAATGVAGAFWSGNAASTYPSGWKTSTGTLTTLPTVTVGTAPVMRITQVTSSTRIAMVCFMGIYVAWTPGARNPILEPGGFGGRGARNVNQGINRASAY